MHEFGIARDMLTAVLSRAEASGANQVESIELEIGPLSGIEAEALTFAFTALSQGTIAQNAELNIQHNPLQCFCDVCMKPFACAPLAYDCPDCGILSKHVISGKEMSLIAMEVN